MFRYWFYNKRVKVQRFLSNNWIWLIPIIPFTLSIILGVMIRNDLNLKWDWSYCGLTEMAEYQDIPLKLFTFSIALFTIILTVYRVKKADKQLTLAESNNLRSSYIELEKVFKDDFKVIDISLIKNLNHFYPNMNRGVMELDFWVSSGFEEIIEIIETCKNKWDFGVISGFKLLPILAKNDELKEYLVFKTSSIFSNFHDPLELREDIIKLADEYVKLIEFHSNFHPILEPSEINSVKDLIDELKNQSVELKKLKDKLLKLYSKHENYGHLKGNEKLDPFDDDGISTEAEEIFWHNYLRWHNKTGKPSNPYDAFIEDKNNWEDFEFYKRLQQSLENKNSNLNKHIQIKQSLFKGIKKKGSIEKIFRSQDFKRLVKIK